MQYSESLQNRSILNLRTFKLMRERHLKISALSEKSGVAVGTIQKILNDPICNPTLASLEAISKVLETTVSHLIGQRADQEISKETVVPLFDWNNIREVLNDLTTFHNENLKTIRKIKIARELSPHAFSLKAEGTSMFPVFPEGALLTFDMEKQPYDGSYVLVLLKELDKVVFKQLLIDEPYRYIKSVCQNIKDTPQSIRIEDKVLATLVQTQTDY